VPSLGKWQYTCDREATAAAYRLAEGGYTQLCTCNGCRNFVAVRFEAFPQSFIALLESLGIDPVKDGEVYHTCRMSPGKHLYGGWYHFVGALNETGDFPMVQYSDDFDVSLCRKSAPSLPALQEMELVQLEFVARAVPWGLNEAEAE
jgi:hypothetical protein